MNFHDAVAGVFSYAFQSGLLLVVGLILPRLVRLRHPRALLVYWRVLLVAVLLVPLAPLDHIGETSLRYMTIDGLEVEAAFNTSIPAALPGLSLNAIFLVIAGIAILGIARLGLGLGYLNRCRHAALPLSPTPVKVSKLRDRLGLEVPFLVSERLTAPLTYGWLRPAVLLPESFQGLSADQQEGVACHELLHVQRRDWPITLLEELLRAVLWFHPAVWLILPRISLSREQVVDADTVRLTGKRRQYLEALWRVICASRQSVAAVAVPFLGRRDLVDRVAWLQKEISMSKTRIALTVIAFTLVVPAVAVFGASVFNTDMQPDLSLSGPSSPAGHDDQKPEKSEDKLRTTSADSICGEITHPVVTEKVNPKYPESAREDKVTGVVVVETVITEEGIVDDIRVLESTDERLSTAAVEAIEQWRFEPALCDGTPVGVYYNLTVNFRLE